MHFHVSGSGVQGGKTLSEGPNGKIVSGLSGGKNLSNVPDDKTVSRGLGGKTMSEVPGGKNRVNGDRLQRLA